MLDQHDLPHRNLVNLLVLLSEGRFPPSESGATVSKITQAR